MQGEPTSRSAEKVAEYRKTDAYRESLARSNAIHNADKKTRLTTPKPRLVTKKNAFMSGKRRTLRSISSTVRHWTPR